MPTAIDRLLPGLACALALCVVVLGAYVRLSDAGLSCPDWPGCYGRLVAPSTDPAIASANQAFPDSPVESGKAWKEMVHRYLAGALGIAIAWIAWRAWRCRRVRPPGALPFVLVGLVLFQALLGMWTVTLLLRPVVVSAHLLGGLCTLAGLWWLHLRQPGAAASGTGGIAPRPAPAAVRVGLAVSAVLLAAQITLGGWTSANYAALACSEFPRCQAQWWPPMHIAEGFTLDRELGEGAAAGTPLSHEALVGIHMVHRLGALITVIVLGAVSIALARAGPVARRWALATLVLLVLQAALGIAVVLMARPLVVAVAHNAVAALLLLALLAQCHHHLGRRGARAACARRRQPAPG